LKVVIGGKEISVQIRLRRVRNAYLTLSTDYRLKIVLPPRSGIDADELLERKRGWLEKKIAELSQRRRALTEDVMYYDGSPLAITVHRSRHAGARIDGGSVYVSVPEGDDTRQILTSFLRARTEGRVRPLVAGTAEHLGLRHGRVVFGTKRFGYCTRTGDLHFNDKLVCLPRELQELVVLHELVHIKHFNHSREFKAEMAEHMPNFAELDKELKLWDLS